MSNNKRSLSLLGSNTSYPSIYCPSLLESLPRATARETLDIDTHTPPFSGFDLWTAYEISWLNSKGKPIVAIGEFEIPSSSPNIIESKSFKLYLNSFNQTKFSSSEEVIEAFKKDLSRAAGSEVTLRLYPNTLDYEKPIITIPGVNIDVLDIDIDNYSFTPELLANSVCTNSKPVSETIFSNLLKSNCLVTNQPDWGSVIIKYEGYEIHKENLLRYIVSFRNHNEFHEHCVERIFNDIKKYCNPAKLTVFARYTRRGGLDINPFRSDFENIPSVKRLIRQ